MATPTTACPKCGYTSGDNWAQYQGFCPKCNITVSDDEAKFRTVSMNQIRGQYLPMKMARLLSDLQDRYDPATIRRMTGIKEDEFQSLSDLLDIPDIDFSASPTIGTEVIERPIAVNLMLMPDEHGDYSQAMVKAMELAGPMVVPLIAGEVGNYDKAMTSAFELSGVKLRNIGLATICRVFNRLPAADREKYVDELFFPNTEEPIASDINVTEIQSS